MSTRIQNGKLMRAGNFPKRIDSALAIGANVAAPPTSSEPEAAAEAELLRIKKHAAGGNHD